MKLLYTLLGLKLLLASAVQADSITTIQLRNRPADEVIPQQLQHPCSRDPCLRIRETSLDHSIKISISSLLYRAVKKVARKQLLAVFDNQSSLKQ